MPVTSAGSLLRLIRRYVSTSRIYTRTNPLPSFSLIVSQLKREVGAGSGVDVWECKHCGETIKCYIEEIRKHLDAHGILPPYVEPLRVHFDFYSVGLNQ